jgi:hypothetical protein
MNSFKIEIEVNLGQGTIDALGRLFGAQRHVTAAPAEPIKESPKPQPKPQPAPASVVEDDDDLPAGNSEQAPKPTPTESDTRNAVQAARKRGVPAGVIKAYMKDIFGIATSVECPAERRQELIDGLAKLAA